MPIKSTISKDDNLISTNCTGVISMNDFDYYLYEFLSKNDLKGCNEIFDTTEGDWSNIGYSDLAEISRKSSELESIDTSTKFAWVIGDSSVEMLTEFYKSSKLFLTGKSRVLRAFKNYDEAMQWLTAK